MALTYYLGEIPLYVVINHNTMSAELIRNIPNGVIKAIRFVIENELPNIIRILQLYFEKSSHQWKYLLAPSDEGFGRWIDQYIDLDAQIIHKIDSRRKFLEIFHPDSKDELKFLVNPFSEPRWQKLKITNDGRRRMDNGCALPQWIQLGKNGYRLRLLSANPPPANANR